MFRAILCSSSGGQNCIFTASGIVTLCERPYSAPVESGLHSSTCYSLIHSLTHSRTHLLTYLSAPWSRVVLEKLTGFAASQEIPRIYGNRNFITVLTSARHLSLSWARSIQSQQPPPTSWRSILILSSHLRLGLHNGLFPSGFPTKNLCSSSTFRMPER
jgi:hypothetical protein